MVKFQVDIKNNNVHDFTLIGDPCVVKEELDLIFSTLKVVQGDLYVFTRCSNEKI